MKKASLIAALVLAAAVVTGCSAEKGETNNADKPQEEQKVYTYTATEILTTIKEAYGETYLPNMPLDETMIQETYGLNMELVEEAVAEMPMIGFHPDMVLIVKAKDGTIDEIVKQLKVKQKDVIENTLNYPANEEKIKAAKVVSNTNYAAFFLLGNADNASTDPTERKNFAEAEVQKAVEAFNSLFK